MNISLVVTCPTNSEEYSLSLTSYVVSTIILGVSTILATPGNILVIWVITKTAFLRAKAVNMLIVNLCLIDLIASCFDMPLMCLILQFNYHCFANPSTICRW